MSTLVDTLALALFWVLERIGVFRAAVDELPRAPVVPPPPPDLQRRFLATRLRVVNALFAAHLGGAHVSTDGIPCRCHRPERWPN